MRALGERPFAAGLGIGLVGGVGVVALLIAAGGTRWSFWPFAILVGPAVVGFVAGAVAGGRRALGGYACALLLVTAVLEVLNSVAQPSNPWAQGWIVVFGWLLLAGMALVPGVIGFRLGDLARRRFRPRQP